LLSLAGWLPLVGVASVHNMKFLLLALKSGSADLLIE
jgi:hypothetical protein